jgi:hypothetical protein
MVLNVLKLVHLHLKVNEYNVSDENQLEVD